MGVRGWRRWVWPLVGLLVVSALAVDMVRGTAGPGLKEIQAVDLAGKTWSLEASRGKPVLLSFFSTTCGPCRMEFPAFVQFQQKFANRGLQVVYLTQESREVIQAEPGLATAPITFLIDAVQAFQDYRVDSLPRTLLISASGEVLMDLPGYHPALVQQLEDKIETLPVQGG